MKRKSTASDTLPKVENAPAQAPDCVPAEDAAITSTIVVTGSYDDWVWFKEKLIEQGDDPEEWDRYDLRDIWPKDPCSSVNCGEDYKSPLTFQQVAAQETFAEHIYTSISQMTTQGRRKQFHNCTHGVHRASVAGASIESHVNSLLCKETKVRLYNCKWLHFHRCRGKTQYENVMENINKWCETPWLVAGGATKVEELTGWKDCESDAKAFEQMLGLQDTLNDDWHRPWTLTSKLKPTPPAGPPPGNSSRPPNAAVPPSSKKLVPKAKGTPPKGDAKGIQKAKPAPKQKFVPFVPPPCPPPPPGHDKSTWDEDWSRDGDHRGSASQDQWAGDSDHRGSASQ